MTTGRTRRTWSARAAAVVLTLTIGLAACGTGSGDEPTSGPVLTGIERSPAPEVGEVVLPDAANADAPFTLAGPSDGLLLVFFGYTSCPDVCPTTMTDMARALDTLPAADAERVDTAMVTVDPDRDTVEVLTHYVQSFVPEGHALRTDDPATLRSAADAFGADYMVQTTPEGDIDVMHTPHLYVVDDSGRLRLQWPFGTTGDDMGSDIAILLDDLSDAA